MKLNFYERQEASQIIDSLINDEDKISEIVYEYVGLKNKNKCLLETLKEIRKVYDEKAKKVNFTSCGCSNCIYINNTLKEMNND